MTDENEKYADQAASESLVKLVITINTFQAFLEEMRNHVDSEEMLLTGMTHAFTNLLTKELGPHGSTEFLKSLAAKNAQFEIANLH